MRLLILLFITLICLLLAGCGPTHHAKPTQSPIVQLQAKYQTYLVLSEGQIEPQTGWIIPTDCDSLLYNSLFFVARGEEYSAGLAEGSESGQWFRNPGQDCYSNPNGSDISRDMFIGLFIYLYDQKDLRALQDIWNYGEAHNWKMGREKRIADNRTILTPSTVSLLARAIKGLGGHDYSARFIPEVYNTDAGYVSHLSMLSIYLKGRINGKIEDRDLQALFDIQKHDAQNPLAGALIHRYTDGDQTLATEQLLDEWPADRLPTSTDWCTPWRLATPDASSDLKPCTAGSFTTYSGGDFLFAAAIILNLV